MLELFVMSTCPYCKKVMNFMDENNFEYIKSDISNPDNYLKLLTLGGKEQVPFIVDHDNKKRMYESDLIIDYLRNLKEKI